MRKSVFLLWFFPILFISLVQSKNIYDGWVYSGVRFTIENETYLVNYIYENNATVLYFPSGVSGLIDASHSQCTSVLEYTVCQTKQRFQINGENVPPDIHDLRLNVSLYLKINKTGADIAITREILPESLFLGDVSEIKTKIENTGQFDIVNISYYDYYSNNFSIEIVNGCWKKNNSVVWIGDLNKSKNTLCTYRLMPLKNTIYKNMAVVSFIWGEKTVEKTTSRVFDVKEQPFTFDITYTNKTLKTEEVFLGNIVINPLNNFNLKELKIVLPSSFELINYSRDFKYMQNALIFENYEMRNQNKKTFYFNVKSRYAGIFLINTSLSYSYNNIVKKVVKSFLANYAPEIFQIGLYNVRNSSVLRISNTKNVSFKDIEISIANFRFNESFLEPNRFKEFNFQLLPDSKYDVGVKYVSQYGQTLYNSFVLAYGESTDAGEVMIKNQKNEAITQKKGVFIDKNIMIVAALIVMISAILFVGLTRFKAKVKKTVLDEEVEKIKEEDTVEEDEINKIIEK